MQPLLALLTITLSLSGAAFAADDHYTCNRTDTAGSAPSKFDLRRWADLLRIKLSLSGNTVFAGTDAGSFRFKDFTSQNRSYQAVILSPSIYAGRSSGKVRLEIPAVNRSKYVTYDCSQVK